MVKYRGPFVLQMPEEAWFDCTMMQKDMELALEAGRTLGVALPATAATNELLTAARAMGLAGKDFAALFKCWSAWRIPAPERNPPGAAIDRACGMAAPPHPTCPCAAVVSITDFII